MLGCTASFLTVLLHLALSSLHLSGCVGARLGNGAKLLSGYPSAHGLLLYWYMAKPDEVAHVNGATVHVQLERPFGRCQCEGRFFYSVNLRPVARR